MNGTDLFNAIIGIDEDIIDRARSAKNEKGKAPDLYFLLLKKKFQKTLKKYLQFVIAYAILCMQAKCLTLINGGATTMTTTTTTKTLKADIMEKMEIMQGFSDGTYDVETLFPVEFIKGYQVTFCQEGDNYSDEEFLYLCEMFKAMSSDGKIYCGVFYHNPEISFHFADFESAVKMAKKFNQVSIWNWKIGDEYKTGGTGKR